MLNRFVPGQRWLSQTEPELGLGLVIKTEPDTVTIVFPSSETTRVYTIEAPPLTRVRFSVGDVLKTQDGKSFVVEDLAEKDGRVTYFSKAKKIDESRLSDSLTFSKPIDRLLNGQVDDKSIYNLRHRALYRRFKTFRSPLRGLLGGRYYPSAHQLHVATQATRTTHPRVLLADEPGLGRRLEAGLVLQRLQIAGNARRVLLTAPEEDLERMETELSRRFGFSFTRLSEDDLAPPAAKKAVAAKSAKAKEAAPPPNPFLESGDWLSLPLELLKSRNAHAAAAAGWDVLIVDGAEALEWDETTPGQNYRSVEEVAGASKSLILVTASGPETDPDGHYGRIRLLDPEEFPTARRYHKHQKDMEPVAAAVEKLSSVTNPDREAESMVKALTVGDTKLKELLKFWKEGREGARDVLIDHLLDGQELGRAVFRNTSARMPLSAREVEFIRLETKPEVRDALREEYKHHRENEGKPKTLPSAIDSPLAVWLASLISPPIQPAPPPMPRPSGAPPEPEPPPPPPPPKALVVCSSRCRAKAAAKALLKKVPDKIALVTDEPRDGLPDDVRAIVVGAEDVLGRGFDGVDFLVLWDLPHDLDGARAASGALEYSGISPARILAPFVEETPQEFEARWLHEGLDALSTSSQAQDAANEEYFRAAHDIAKRIGVRHNPKLMDELKAVIKKTKAAVEVAARKADKHRDRFLEMASCRPGPSEQALSRMTSSDEDQSLDLFAHRVLEQCGMLVAQSGPRTSFVKWNPEANFRLEAVPKEGLTATCSRRIALTRETAEFLTWDHSLVASATERLLVTAIGNTAYVVWEDERAQLVLLEGIYLAEPTDGEANLQVARFMPPTPVRVVVSHELEDLSSQYTTELVNKNVRNGRREWLRNNARPLHNLIPNMLRNLNQRAEIKMQELAAKASHQMESILTAEITRHKRLPETTRRTAAIQQVEQQIVELKKLLAKPQLSLDSLRLIRRGPSGKGI